MNIVLTDKNFDSVMASHALVVIVFSADWCSPCHVYHKVIDSLESNYPDVMFAFVDIEVEKDLAEEFDVKSVPATLIVRSQVVVSVQTGLIEMNDLSVLIEQAHEIEESELAQLRHVEDS